MNSYFYLSIDFEFFFFFWKRGRGCLGHSRAPSWMHKAKNIVKKLLKAKIIINKGNIFKMCN